MNNVKKLVFATNNAHKLEEARQIIGDGFEIVSLAEVGCHDEIPETADTLEGNALIKARWVKEKYGYDCFADDTGLMVDALGGAPGVYSARYAGEHCSPADNVAKLLGEMQGLEDRKAHFATVIALLVNGEQHTFEGRVEGSIATARHGDGGFGYDPIFVAEETGRCFAEMTPDEKNAISHRGRAMRKLRDFLGVITAIMICALFGADALASQWRLHPSYDGQMVDMVETPDAVYFLGTKQDYRPETPAISTLHGVLYRYSKENESIEPVSGTTAVPGNTVRAIAYNYDKKYLMAAFDDGEIDMIFDNGEVARIFGFKVADSSLDKTVNDITFDTQNGRAYLASNFGYIVIDDSRREVETSRVFNEPINSVAVYKDKLWLGKTDGLFVGDKMEFVLSNFKLVSARNKVKRLTPAGSELYLQFGTAPRLFFSRIRNYDGSPTRDGVVIENGVFMGRSRDKTYFVSTNSMRILGLDGSDTQLSLPADYAGSSATSLDGRTFWLSSGRKGISSMRAPSDGSDKWTLLVDRFLPNASSAFMCTSMAVHPEFGMLVRNHGYEYNFNSAISVVDDLISAYKDMTWTPMSATYRTSMPGLVFDNPWGIAIDPQNTDHVYCGSVRSGLLRLDLRNPEKSLHISMPTDMNGGYGHPGFVAAAPDVPEGCNWKIPCVFAPPAFDSQGNLWTSFVNQEPNTKVGTGSYNELWVWTPEDRAASTSASNFRPMKKLKFEDMPVSNTPVVLPLKGSSRRNIVLFHGNTAQSPLAVLDHNGTLDNRADDRLLRLTDLTDQDGQEISLVNVHAWYEDQSTGLVWVSTGVSLFTFDPLASFDNPGAVRRIKVPRNDGTNLADYLLEGVRVNCITSDASGRKWFGTNGTGLVCTSAEGREIIATYTPDNSEMPGSSVYAACYNPQTGSMMVSTDKGLCELFLSSAGGSGSDSGVKAYPNPVRPDYYGYVTIEGLPSDAMVKIVDTAGNLIKECGQADNGTLQWDVTNRMMKRVPGGVYYVIASNGPASDSYSRMTKILVVE